MTQAMAQDSDQHDDGAGLAQATRDARRVELASVFLIATGFCGLVLALCGIFGAAQALALGLLATWAWSRRMTALPLAGPATAFRLSHAIPVLLVAIVFRVLPYPYVLGGQDPGVYANVAAHIVHSHGIAVSDAEFASISAQGPAAAARYRADNYTVPFLPGVYTIKGRTPGLVFQFYHLFPVWMAIAGDLFGIAALGWGLTLLSLASVLYFQRLAVLLTGRATVGVLAGLLLACNPLHAYFSRLPVTEVPTLAYSLLGFGWLASYALSPPGQRPLRWLVLSALGFASLFLTRISGFMYLPFIVGLAMALQLSDPDRARARAIATWSLAVVAAFLGSVAYGLTWSRPYALKIYDISFSPLFGPAWPLVLAAAAVLAACLWAPLFRESTALSLASPGRRILAALAAATGPLFLLLLLFGAAKAYQLGFTARYAGSAEMRQFPGLVGAGWQSVARTSIPVAAMYLFPPALLALLVLAQRRWADPLPRVLLLFVLGFFAYEAVLNWTVPYQPYYARYLASELVPYSLLFLACAWHWAGPGTTRRALGWILGAGLAWSFVFSLAQADKMEDAGARDSIARLAGIADHGDLIALDIGRIPDPEHKILKTTLSYVFDRHVASISRAALGDPSYLAALDRAYDDVFLVTRDAPPRGFERVDSVRLRADRFALTAYPPVRMTRMLDSDYGVFRLRTMPLAAGRVLRFDAATDARITNAVGTRSGGRLVSDGRAGYLMYGPYIAIPGGRYRLLLRGRWGRGGGRATLDVAKDTGANILATQSLAGPQAGAAFESGLDVEVPESGASDLEVRLRVDTGTRIDIEGYTLTSK